MKSNKCLFSKTVFKSNVLRFLPFAAPLLIAELIVFPLALVSNTGKITLSTFASVSLASDIISMFFAGLFGILVFSYLFKPNTCNAFHAFPVGRNALFFTGTISAYTLLVIPQLIGLAAGIPILLRMSVVPAKCIVLGFVSILGVSFVALSTAVLAVMLAGNIFGSVVLYGVINFVYVIAESIFEAAVAGFGAGITGVSTASKNVFLSPLANLVLSKSGLSESAVGAMVVEQKVQLSDYYKLLIVFVVMAVIIFALAYLLYKSRKLEAVGDMVSFKAEIPVLSVIGAVFGGAFSTALLYAVFTLEKTSIYICYFVFSLICYFAAQMIIRKTAKVFSAKNFGIWALTAIISLGAVLGFALYETYLIPSDNIKSIRIETDYPLNADSEEYAYVAEMHNALIKNELKGATPAQLLLGTGDKDKSDNGFDVGSAEIGSNTSYSISLTYTLKNGRTVGREYAVRYGTKEIDEYINKLEEKHPPKTVFDWMDEVDYTLTGCEIVDYTKETSGGSFKTISLNAEDAEKMLELCKADLDARKSDVRSTDRDEENGVTEADNISFTFTVNNMDDYCHLKNEEFINDFSHALIDNSALMEDEPELSKVEFIVTVGTLKKGGAAERFMTEKINNN